MRTCGATPGGPSLDGIDLSVQSVIQGVVLRDGLSQNSDGIPNGGPVERAHVRLLDSAGEFTAEVPTNSQGQFRFFAAPGAWTLVVQAQGARIEQSVIATQGQLVDLVLTVEPLAK